MVQVTQTEDEVKIIIELNRLIMRKPDIVLMSHYFKFNNPPIFFERHLTGEIDEVASFCRILKNEARIILVKKQKGIWPEIFQKFSKEELLQKRLEISDQIVERNKERDKQLTERYEKKRRSEIEKELKRESVIRERVKQLEDNACRDALMVGVRKETQEKPSTETTLNTKGNRNRVATPTVRPLAAVRSRGKINVCFSKFSLHTPKRESQEGIQRPFTIQDNSAAEETKTSKSINKNE